MAQKPKEELLTCRAEAETGNWLTGATIERAGMTMQLKEGRRPVKPKGWKIEVQPET